jgi:hypothetical protein
VVDRVEAYPEVVVSACGRVPASLLFGSWLP